MSTTNHALAEQSAGSDLMQARSRLYNGNITSMVTCLPKAQDYSSTKTITAEAL